MLNQFNNIERETEIGFMEASMIANMLDFNIIIEAENQSVVDKFINKMKETVENMKRKIQEFVTSAVIKSKLQQIKEIFQKNPSLKDEKIKVKDYEKLNKLSMDTAKELETTKDVNATMEKYRKQRNKILAGGAVTTMSLATAFVYIIKKKDEKIKDLEDLVNGLNKTISKQGKEIDRLHDLNTKIKDENKKLNRKVDMLQARNAAAKAQTAAKHLKQDIQETSSNVKKNADSVTAKAKAIVEVTSDQSKDILGSVKEIAGTLLSGESTIKKATNVAKEVGNIGKKADSIVSGNAVDEKIRQLKERGNALQKERKRFEAVANNENRSDGDREKARVQAEKIRKEQENLFREIKKLEK